MSDLTKEELIKLAEIAGKTFTGMNPSKVWVNIRRNQTEYWNPAENIALAMEVLEAMVINKGLFFLIGNDKKDFYCSLFDTELCDEDSYLCHSSSTMMSLAICKAVLKASEEE